jgi:thiamine biosynthesis lipoprotein
MMRAALALFLLIATWPVHAATVRDARGKMGSQFEITAVHEDAERAQKAIDAAYAEIERIEAVISEWRPTSETSAINAAAGDRPVTVSDELFELIRRSLKVSELTGGAFDITWLSVGRLWDMKVAKKPAADAIAAALADTGYRHLILDGARHSVFLDRAGTKIGFGAIGKGYAANRAARLLREAGATGGIVNASGDLFAFGKREDGSPWRIGIADPFHKDEAFAYVDLSEQAIVTSGDYERYVEIDGKKYSHILDPRTGYPVEELRSVTIICPDAELADALATGVTVLGVERGLALVNRLKNVHAFLVDRNGKLHQSKDLQTLFTPTER